MWQMSTHANAMLFCYEISLLKFYALLSWNLYCSDLGTLCVKKISKIALVEKKLQMWGLPLFGNASIFTGIVTATLPLPTPRDFFLSNRYGYGITKITQVCHFPVSVGLPRLTKVIMKFPMTKITSITIITSNTNITSITIITRFPDTIDSPDSLNPSDLYKKNHPSRQIHQIYQIY